MKNLRIKFRIGFEQIGFLVEKGKWRIDTWVKVIKWSWKRQTEAGIKKDCSFPEIGGGFCAFEIELTDNIIVYRYKTTTLSDREPKN